MKIKPKTYIKEVQDRIFEETSPFRTKDQLPKDEKSLKFIQELYEYVKDYEDMKEEFRSPRDYYIKNKDK